MDIVLGLSLLAALCGLFLATRALHVARELSGRVVEPIELRRQVLAFDELLTEHTDRLRAAYARQRKRDKSLTAALDAATAPEPTGPAIVEDGGVEVDHKASIRQKARQMGIGV